MLKYHTHVKFMKAHVTPFMMVVRFHVPTWNPVSYSSPRCLKNVEWWWIRFPSTMYDLHFPSCLGNCSIMVPLFCPRPFSNISDSHTVTYLKPISIVSFFGEILSSWALSLFTFIYLGREGIVNLPSLPQNCWKALPAPTMELGVLFRQKISYWRFGSFIWPSLERFREFLSVLSLSLPIHWMS